MTLAGCVSEPNPMEQKAGVRLSCQAVLLGDAEVWFNEEQTMECKKNGRDIHKCDL